MHEIAVGLSSTSNYMYQPGATIPLPAQANIMPSKACIHVHVLILVDTTLSGQMCIHNVMCVCPVFPFASFLCSVVIERALAAAAANGLMDGLMGC